MRKKIIVNADDFGRHRSINRAVIRGFTDGCVTSASLMAGGDAFADAVIRARAHPALGVGVHFTLVGGRPVAAAAEIPSLLQDDGCFYPDYPAFIRRYLGRKIRLAEVRLELAAQLAKVKQAGLAITHVDGHQHMHILPGIFGVALDVAAAAGVRAVRTPQIPVGFTGGYPRTAKQLAGRGGLAVLARLAAYQARRRGFWTPDHFCGIVAGENVTEACLYDIIRSLKDGVSEIMLHPGEHDETLRRDCGWRHGFEEELQAVLSRRVLKEIERQGIERIHFLN